MNGETVPDQSTNAPYDVRRTDGALVVTGVDLDTAIGEKARLNAEARVTNPETGLPTGMVLGAVVRYEVTTSDGLVIP